MTATRAVEPNGNAGGPMMPFVVLGAGWAVIALVWAAWLAGRIAALLTGHPWRTGPGFGSGFAADLLQQHWVALWPGVPTWLVAIVYAVLVAVAVAAAVTGWLLWQQQRPHPDDPLPALADRRDVAAMTLPGVAARAQRLRPSLAGRPVRDITPAEAGIVLGAHRRRAHGRGPTLYASWEDVVLAVMAPRAGKTTALAVPAVINAPGAVLATSNKPDLWAATSAHRAAQGPIWVFDPQAITHEPRSWWWNPLAMIDNVEEAFRLADHFVQQIRHGSKSGEDFWVMAAHDLLTCFILAAALNEGTLTDVQTWLSDPTDREPVTILKTGGFEAAARSLAGRQAGAPETRDGVYETARTAAACLANPLIMAWVTPPSEPMPSLDVTTFAEPTAGRVQTLYLLSKDGAGNAAPLVAGLTDQVLREAVRVAELRGGRLDPVLLAVLDEAANICKISDLPELYSHFGSRGILPITILQSYQQGQRVWGEHGMGALWSAATCKLVGAGIDDARFAEDLSRLIGEHDVTVGSHTRDGSGHSSWQTSVRRQRILDPAQIRALPKGTGLLLSTGVRVAMLDLLPWYTGPHADRLTAAFDQVTRLITTRALASQRVRRRPNASRRPSPGGPR
jgi:type IV secretory pathway TraG/TraD family ATPase VirD4